MLHWPAQPWLSRARRSHHSAAMNPTVLGVQHRQPSACNFQVAQASRPVIVRCAEDGLDVPLPAAAYMDTEAKLQQLNSLKRLVALVMLSAIDRRDAWVAGCVVQQ